MRDKLVDGGRVGRVARDTHDREWRSDLDLLAHVRKDAQHRARDLRLDGHIDFLRGYLVDLLAEVERDSGLDHPPDDRAELHGLAKTRQSQDEHWRA